MAEAATNPLELERQRLADEIARLTETSQQTETDPKTGKVQLSADAYAAQTRLQKLTDDYRALLIAMKPSTAGQFGEVKTLEDGRTVRIMPDNTVIELPGATTKGKSQTVDQQTVTVGGTVYGVDPDNPTGPLIPRSPTSEDEKKKTADRAKREYNEALTGHYATDDEMLDFTTKYEKLGIDKQTAARLQTEFENSQRRLDAAEARAAAMAPVDIESKKASTAGTLASTAQTLTNTDIAQQKLPYDLAQAGATTEGTIASTAGTKASTQRTLQQIQQANAPTVQTPPTGMYQWSRDPNSGVLTQTGINPEYVPKTQAEIAARATQINQIAEAKQAEILAKNPKAGTAYTPEMASAEFNSWYDKQVAPQLGVLKAAQQTALQEEQRLQMAARQAAMTSALGAGTQAVNAFNATKGKIGYVGPEYQQAVNQIRAGANPAGMDLSKAVEYQGPDPMDLAAKGTANALKYIDSNAAAAAGAPPPNLQATDFEQALGRDRYMPAWLQGGGAPPPPPPAPAAVVTAPPPPPPPVPVVAGANYKPGWPGSDPRLSGILDPTLYDSNYAFGG